MTLSNIIPLFGTMIVLGMLPSPSVFAVVARSISSGFYHGLVTVIGIVVGDFFFILLAIYGLSAITKWQGSPDREMMTSLFILVKYLGSGYLIWLGIQLWRSKTKISEIQGIEESSWVANFLTGLMITLADHKAIFFYMSFFPAFIDLTKISILDVGLILLLAATAIGGSKLFYAYLANRARFLFTSSRAKKGINVAAGTIMIATGIVLLAKN